MLWSLVKVPTWGNLIATEAETAELKLNVFILGF